MRTIVMVIILTIVAVACCPDQSAHKPGAKKDKVAKAEKSAKKDITKADLKSIMEKLNYTVGTDVAKSFERNEVKFDEAIFLKGLYDSMEKKDTLLTEEEMRGAKQEHSKKMREKKEAERTKAAEENKKKGEKFLAENGKKEGVTTLESGLQYKVIKAGEGAKPAATDEVSVHYKGTLIDGTEFDSSLARKKPANFKVNRVVKGWTEALQLMPVGSKWELYIPSDLGYGKRGSGRKIGPNEVLIFEVELLEIVPPKDPAAKGADAAKAALPGKIELKKPAPKADAPKAEAKKADK